MARLSIVANIITRAGKIDWESRELRQAHMSAQHLQDYMTATEGAIEEFTLNDMAKLV